MILDIEEQQEDLETMFGEPPGIQGTGWGDSSGGAYILEAE